MLLPFGKHSGCHWCPSILWDPSHGTQLAARVLCPTSATWLLTSCWGPGARGSWGTTEGCRMSLLLHDLRKPKELLESWSVFAPVNSQPWETPWVHAEPQGSDAQCEVLQPLYQERAHGSPCWALCMQVWLSCGAVPRSVGCQGQNAERAAPQIQTCRKIEHG